MIAWAAAAFAADPDARGEVLFRRVWLEADPRVLTGDGLGPRFLGRSCAECHNVGGVGGSGGQSVLGASPPALFGAGLLDAIPDEVLEARAAESGGSVARTAGGAVGRFGWDGRFANLREAVDAACTDHLGLQTPTRLQPGPSPPGPDLTAAQVDALTTFVVSLPAPIRLDTPGATRGEEVFLAIGCATCHPPWLGSVAGAYTDLLVHDLGGALPVLTAPLWGVRDSGPWMSDGSAPTLGHALDQHEGEARPVALAWLLLPAPDQAALEVFLRSLAAPLPGGPS